VSLVEKLTPQHEFARTTQHGAILRRASAARADELEHHMGLVNKNRHGK
jgi:hypothetical protein